MGITPPSLTDEKATRIMLGLRSGKTLRKLWVKALRLEVYFSTHPEYAEEARPLIEANVKAASLRKGDILRTTTHCRAGLHLMSGDNIMIDPTHGRKRCRACRQAASARAAEMSPAVIEAVKRALIGGATLRLIRKTVLPQIKILYRRRREDPDFDQFVLEHIKTSGSRGQKLRHQRIHNVEVRAQNNVYFEIRAMLPANFPGRDDVISDIFEAMLNGGLRREDVKGRIQTYVTTHNRMYPTKFAKFGNSPLVSLDEVMFEDGSMTRGDAVSRGLWD